MKTLSSLLLTLGLLTWIPACLKTPDTRGPQKNHEKNHEKSHKKSHKKSQTKNKKAVQIKKTSKEKKKPMPSSATAPSESNILHIQLKDNGLVKIKLRPDLAPLHVERVKTLTKQGFYNGLKFHRVIDGFMAQTGDPKGDGTGGSKLPDLRAEFTKTPFKRGVLGMARAQSPHSANSQFFIMLEENSSLNGQYTVFGEVTEGMEFVDQIRKGSRHLNGSVSDPDVMVKVTLQ